MTKLLSSRPPLPLSLPVRPYADLPSVSRAERERRLFDALRHDGSEVVTRQAFVGALRGVGLRLDDPRLGETAAELARLCATGNTLDLAAFTALLKPNIVLLERALQGHLAIPDFVGFCAQITTIYEQTRKNTSGAVADYIPQLARVNPELYGVALCTVDGQRLALGDAQVDFCVQSCCKPINYCLALETRGEATVHRHIGREPSGHSFNELTLNKDDLPHNPMINAGAVMACSLIRPELSNADRFDLVTDTWRRLSAGRKPGFSNPTYLSERQTADRNFALGYFMREKKAFPEGTDLLETLEFYFQCCSIEMNAESMSLVAAALANGGICPLTGERVFSAGTVQKCLSLMYSCGMYDFSGEWAFTIGLPAKSGVAGAILVVVPGVMGLCTWSPRLDPIGNSVRGVGFFRELLRTYDFHNYDHLGSGDGKQDPRLSAGQTRAETQALLCWAATEGDLTAIRRLVARGVPLDASDYDGRTALHLAVCGQQEAVVAYFIAQGVPLSPEDRWGHTPLDDARREGCAPLAALLEAHGAQPGSPR